MKETIGCLILILAVAGCATQEPTQRSNLTPGMAKTRITEGVTTQAEVLDIFGPPNIVTQNKSGSEVWTYDRVSIDRSASEKFGTLIILGANSRTSSVGTATFTLMLEFDDNDVVQESSYRSSTF